MRIKTRLALLFLFVLSSNLVSQGAALAQDGEALYTQYCASCHAAPTDLRTPPRSALGGFSANSVYHALTQGLMQAQGAALSDEQKITLAQYLTRGTYKPEGIERLAQCTAPIPNLQIGATGTWSGWGNGDRNARHQTNRDSAINASNVADLELAWVFGFEDGSNARAQPSVVSGVMFMGSNSGNVYALDLASGCAYWTFLATTEVRGSLSIVHSEVLDKVLVVGADASNRVFVLDASTGARVWHADVDSNPYARSTGSPIVSGDLVFVPVSSAEVVVAANPAHECCSFRGNVAAFDLNTGEKRWHTYIMEEAKEVGLNSAGKRVFAPSGAPIWDAPTVDAKRRRVYVGTGQNYSRPASNSSDSVIAFNMDSGAIEWIMQTTGNDAFTMACTAAVGHPNCPDPGPDLDIGASVLSVTLSTGKDILVAGTKGGVVFALDPDAEGKVLWQTRVGRGGALGGVHWGMSFAGDIAFVPVSDRATGLEGEEGRQPGLHAIDMKTGESVWYSEALQRCEASDRACLDVYSAPPSSTADLVVAGALNGHLFAHDQASGAVLWEYDTVQDFSSVNEVPAKGGAIDSAGPVFSGDYMIVNSGYATFGQLPGNALLVFKLPR